MSGQSPEPVHRKEPYRITPTAGDEAPAVSRWRLFARGLAEPVAAGVVRCLPAAVLRTLAGAIGSRDPGILTRAASLGDRSLRSARLPERIDGFEDLAFLFWHHPMVRGILRQDLDEAAALYRRVRGLGARRGVEIGRYGGGSTLLLAAAMDRVDASRHADEEVSGPTAELLSIDLAPQDDDGLRGALRALGLESRVRLEVGDANLREPEGPLDFVFVDGDHTYHGARRDHLRWGAALRSGGLLIHHDMGRSRPMATGLPALARLRRDIERYQAGELEIVEEAGSMIFFRRIGAGWTRFGDES